MNIGKYLKEFREEMELKNYANNSIELYINVVYQFLKEFEQNFTQPKDISEKIIKEWLKQSPSISTLKIRIGALKNFYIRVVHQPLKFRYIEYPRKETKLPIILDYSEVKAIFSTCKNLKHLAILYLLYADGLRVGEIINLKISDIDSKAMIIHIRKAKGNRDRIAPLDKICLDILRKYFLEYKPKEYLFNGQNNEPQYSESSIRQFLKKYSRIAEIKKKVYPHLFRHTSITHNLENGTDIRLLQIIAGHKNINTTCQYAHISPKFISSIPTPLSFITVGKINQNYASKN